MTRDISQANFLDLSRDVKAVARLGTSVEAVDDLLAEAMDAFGKLVPFDLATIMELEGEELRVRVARGKLAGDLLTGDKVKKHRLSLQEFPGIRALIASGRSRAFGHHDHAKGDGDPFDGVLDLPHGHHCMVVPLKSHSVSLGVMTLDRTVCGGYTSEVVELADVFGKLLALAMSYGEQSALLSRLHDQLAEQNRLLAQEVRGKTDACRLLEELVSPAMQHVQLLARQVAATDTPVLVVGETGTGKEVLASAIHGWSARRHLPMIAVNCAALPAGLIESELFGHVKGAFSGATANRIGRFQAANGGTLFLDEVGELPLELQSKLLRVLQDGCFEPVGSDRTVRVDVRILAATNVDLLQAVAARTFREDLYYRLAVFPIRLPPLRARTEDIPTIAQNYLESLSRRTRRGPWRLGERALAWLGAQPWPGNVRELLNALERATILATGPELRFEAGGSISLASSPGVTAPPASEPVVPLEEAERRHIQLALERTGGKIHGPAGAAMLLDINPSTLRSRMQKLGLGRQRVSRA